MATMKDPRVVMSPGYQMERRRTRRPQHKFTLKYLPWQFQPFMLAPVLPGETLSNLLLQSRVVTDPLDPKLKLMGWWTEYYFFYVKHRDLTGVYNTSGFRDGLSDMMLNPAYDATALRSAASAKYYHFDNGINYTLEAAKRVLEEYFRDEGEEWNTVTIDGMPAVRIYGKGQNDPFDSLTLDAAYADLGVQVPSGADGTVEDLEYAQMQWMAMRDAGLMAMDYEDFIRSYGVQVREDENSPNLHKPELIKYIREWSYPTNMVEPTTGVPASAISWSVAERSDKRVFCSEPGWIFGATCSRPKIYLSAQTGSVAHGMDSVHTWLPPVLHGKSDISHKNFAYSQGPLPDLFDDTPGVGGSSTSGYWIDLRDLLAYGDQFSNYALAGEPGMIALPTNTGQRRYATLAEAQAFFADIDDPSVEGVIKADGVVSLSILGRQSPKPGQLVLGSGSTNP